MKRLIDAIRDEEVIHYLYNYTAEERDRIIRRVKKEFKADVREISTVMDWKRIKEYSGRIKILKYADKIVNQYRLGDDFESLKNDGSIYIFFSKNRIEDPTLKPHWFNFIKTLDDRVKYKYTPPGRKKRIKPVLPTGKEAKINYRKTASFFSHLLLISLLIIYLLFKGMKEKNFESFDFIFITYTALDVANLFLGFHLCGFFKKSVEPFIYHKLKKNKSVVGYIIEKYFRPVGNTLKTLVDRIKVDREFDEE